MAATCIPQGPSIYAKLTSLPFLRRNAHVFFITLYGNMGLGGVIGNTFPICVGKGLMLCKSTENMSKCITILLLIGLSEDFSPMTFLNPTRVDTSLSKGGSRRMRHLGRRSDGLSHIHTTFAVAWGEFHATTRVSNPCNIVLRSWFSDFASFAC